MPLAIARRGSPNREKPTEIVRGVDSRLPWAWDGLCFGVPFHDPTRDSARDIVANAAPSAVSGLSWIRDNRGNAAAYLDASSYLDYADNPAHNRPSTEITAYVRFRRAGAGDAEGGIFIKEYSTGDPWQTWNIQHSGVGDTLAGYITVNGTGYWWENFDYEVPTTLWLSVFLRWQSGSNPVLDILGERGETLSSNFRTGVPSGTLSYASNKPIRLNAVTDVTQNYNAEYSQALLWNRRLTNTEVQALVADPFGWYSPRRMTVGLSGTYLLAPQHVINGTAAAVPAQGGD